MTSIVVRLGPRRAFEVITELCAMYFGVTVKDILGPSRRPRVCQARHVAIALVRTLVKWSYPEIARAFGRVDFTSAYNSVQRVNEDPELAAMAMKVGAELHERLHVEAA